MWLGAGRLRRASLLGASPPLGFTTGPMEPCTAVRRLTLGLPGWAPLMPSSELDSTMSSWKSTAKVSQPRPTLRSTMMSRRTEVVEKALAEAEKAERGAAAAPRPLFIAAAGVRWLQLRRAAEIGQCDGGIYRSSVQAHSSPALQVAGLRARARPLTPRSPLPACCLWPEGFLGESRSRPIFPPRECGGCHCECRKAN